MAIDSTTAKIKLPTRDERVSRYKRDYKLRNPEASTAEGEQPDIDAKLLADQLVPVDSVAQSAGDALTLLNQSGTDLDKTWEPRGIKRPQAAGAIGYVQITTASGGAPIFLDDEIRDLNSGLRFKCTKQNLSWQNGEYVPIAGVDTGPQTNLAVGTKLTWSQIRPGLGETAFVVEQGESGLSGGRNAAEDDEYKSLIADYQANPAAAGNDAQVQLAASRTPGVIFERTFTYPAIRGNGTSAVIGVIKSSRLGASRRPSEIQRQALESWVVGQFPHGDIYDFPSLLSQKVDVAIEARWSKTAAGWADSVPWPTRYAVGAGKVVVSAVASSIVFTLRTDDDTYSGRPAPQVGQTIGFWNATKTIFSQKKILSIGGTGPWVITCDTNLGASDDTYLPIVGQPCCPWSNSLNAVALEVLRTFGRLGPGEMVANADLFTGSERRKRNPESPAAWPSVLSNKELSNVLDLTELADGTIAEGADTTTTVGVAGVIAYLIEPQYITVFKKPAA